MLRKNRLCGLLCALFTVIWSCSSPGGEGTSCQTQTDCVTGLLCVAQTCQFAPSNGAPTARLSSSSEVALVGQTVRLDGSESSDPEQEALTFAWTLRAVPTGSQTRLEANQATASLTPDLPGDYVISLVVFDGANYSAPATWTLSALASEQGPADTKNDEEPTTRETPHEPTAPDASPDVAPVETQPEAPPAQLTRLEPTKGKTGEKVIVRLLGTGFAQDARAYFEESLLFTLFVSSQELKCELDLRTIPPGTYKLQVRQSNGTYTQTLSFIVEQKTTTKPPPLLRVLDPWQGTTGSKVPLSLRGNGFVNGAKVVFRGQTLPTTFVSSAELKTTAALDLTSVPPGAYKVKVQNPDGIESNEETFTVLAANPAPSIVLLFPQSINIGDKTNTLELYGRNLKTGVKLVIGTHEFTSTKGSLTQKSPTYLVAKVDASDLSKWKEGQLDAYLQNPDGQKSNTVKLTIGYALPSIDNITPSGWNTKCNTTLTIKGRNFHEFTKLNFGTTVYQKGDPTYPLTLVDATTLTLPLPARQLSAKTYQITASNSSTTTSGQTPYVITNLTSPTPSIRHIIPSVGTTDTRVSVQVTADSANGGYQSLKPGAVVTFNGKIQPTNCRSATNGTHCYTLEASIDLNGVKPGDYEIFIVNPCNVKSAPLSFNVEAAPEPHISGFQPAFVKVGDKTKIVIKGGNFTQNHQLLWGGKVIKSTYKSATEIETDAIDFASATLGEIDVQIKTASGASSGIAKFSVVNPFAPTISEVVNNVQERGGTLSPMQVLGTGFVLTSEIFVDGKAASTRYVSPTELLLRDIDTKNMKVGIYSITVRNGSRSSNSYPLVLLSPPKPRINYISPSSVVAGTVTKQRITIYGSRFVTTPLPSIVITGPDQKDLSSRFTITTSFPSSTYLYGEFDISGLGTGRYNLQVKNATGELSNAVGFQLTPPPPPTVSSLSPSFIFRHGSANQAVKIIGSNFVNTDLVIFDENSLAALPVTVKQSNEAEFTIDATKLKASREYTVYLRRYLDKNQTQFQDTQKLKLEVRDPPCAAINNCANLTGEACDSADSVCRPKCTTTADCKSLDAKATWTCQSGFCK